MLLVTALSFNPNYHLTAFAFHSLLSAFLSVSLFIFYQQPTANLVKLFANFGTAAQSAI